VLPVTVSSVMPVADDQSQASHPFPPSPNERTHATAHSSTDGNSHVIANECTLALAHFSTDECTHGMSAHLRANKPSAAPNVGSDDIGYNTTTQGNNAHAYVWAQDFHRKTTPTDAIGSAKFLGHIFAFWRLARRLALRTHRDALFLGDLVFSAWAQFKRWSKCKAARRLAWKHLHSASPQALLKRTVASWFDARGTLQLYRHAVVHQITTTTCTAASRLALNGWHASAQSTSVLRTPARPGISQVRFHLVAHRLSTAG
jgi:hypothetical protein